MSEILLNIIENIIYAKLFIMKNSPVVGIAVSEAFSERIAGYLQLSYLWKFIIVNVQFSHNIDNK